LKVLETGDRTLKILLFNPHIDMFSLNEKLISVCRLWDPAVKEAEKLSVAVDSVLLTLLNTS